MKGKKKLNTFTTKKLVIVFVLMILIFQSCTLVNLITGTETWRYAALANALWVDENNFVISSYSVQLFTGTYLYRIGIDNRNIETLLLSDEELTNPSVYNGMYFIHYRDYMYVYNSWNKVSTDDLSGLNEHSFYNPRDSVLYVAYDGELMTRRTDSIYEYLQADSNIDQLLYPDWEKMRLLCLSDSMILELDLTTLARDTILSLEELPSYGITNYDLSKMIVIRDMYDTTKLNIRFHQWNSSSYPVLQIDNNSEHWSVVDTLKREYFSRNSKGDYIKLDGGTVSVIDTEGKVIYTKDLTRSGFIDRY